MINDDDLPDLTEEEKKLTDELGVLTVENIKGIAIRMDLINLREIREVRALCENPDNYKLCQSLMDRLSQDVLMTLANYDKVIDGLGKEHNQDEVYIEIADNMERSFAKLTGHEYVSTIRRQMRFLKALGLA